jgi:ABC-type Fe3+/spermidine/putrescine transport system ATPase subunit
MNAGRIEQFDTPQAVYLKPATAFVAGFLGAINWFGSTGVRPESTRISRDEPHGAPSRRGSVESTLFLGNCVHINAALDSGGRVTAEIPRERNDFREGEAVWISWAPGDEMRFD